MTRPVRVYVAAPFTEWRLVREVQAELRAKGAEISCDWTEGIENLPPGQTDGDVSEEVALKAAIADIEGVLRADACLFLTVADKTLGRGMYVELGAAIVARRMHRIWDDYGSGSNETITDGSYSRDAVKQEHIRLHSRVDDYHADIYVLSRPRIAVCGPHRDATIFSRLGKRFADWRDALPYILNEEERPPLFPDSKWPGP